jgi:protein-L-isoaspartate(D-aspartate) O-methyltransferase
VHVATRNGALGDPDHGPYDRIMYTVGAWDLPPAWWAQLAPSGRLVVPLRWRGQTRSIAFTHIDGVLRSDSVHLCGFVPMVGQDGERSGHIDAHGDMACTGTPTRASTRPPCAEPSTGPGPPHGPP